MPQISRKLLGEGQNLVIGFPDASTPKKKNERKYPSQQVFIFQVAMAKPLFQKYVQLPAIPANTGLNFGYLGTTGHNSGDDIFRIVTDQYWVYHFGITPENPSLRLYSQFSPANLSTTAFDYAPADSASPVNGSDYDYVTSKRVRDIFDPENDYVAVRNDREGKTMLWGFYAEEAIPAGSPLYVVGSGYSLIPVNNPAAQDAILDDARKRARDQVTKTTFVTVAGMHQYNIGTNIPKDWAEGHNTRVLEFEDILG